MGDEWAVYVLKWSGKQLGGNALISINGLGPAGAAGNRVRLSFSAGRIYAHTIKEVIGIK